MSKNISNIMSYLDALDKMEDINAQKQLKRFKIHKKNLEGVYSADRMMTTEKDSKWNGKRKK